MRRCCTEYQTLGITITLTLRLADIVGAPISYLQQGITESATDTCTYLHRRGAGGVRVVVSVLFSLQTVFAKILHFPRKSKLAVGNSRL